MIRVRVVLVNFLFVVMVFMSIAKSARALAMNFTVHSGEEETRTINLAVDDHVLVRFTVVGQSDSSLWFYIVYPNGTAKEFGKVGYLHYSFVCDLKGDYVLRFSNVDSSEDKLVTFECEIEHYIFGIPQMLFLTIIIVLVCIIAVAVFIFMGKTH